MRVSKRELSLYLVMCNIELALYMDVFSVRWLRERETSTTTTRKWENKGHGISIIVMDAAGIDGWAACASGSSITLPSRPKHIPFPSVSLPYSCH